MEAPVKACRARHVDLGDARDRYPTSDAYLSIRRQKYWSCCTAFHRDRKTNVTLL